MLRSLMLRSLTAQFLHQGAHALVLDPKRIFHLWAKSLPTVTHRGNIVAEGGTPADQAAGEARCQQCPDR